MTIPGVYLVSYAFLIGVTAFGTQSYTQVNVPNGSITGYSTVTTGAGVQYSFGGTQMANCVASTYTVLFFYSGGFVFGNYSGHFQFTRIA